MVPVYLAQAEKPLATSCPRGHRKNQDKGPLLCFSLKKKKKSKIKWLTDDGLPKQSGLESQGMEIENTALVSLKGVGRGGRWLLTRHLKDLLYWIMNKVVLERKQKRQKELSVTEPRIRGFTRADWAFWAACLKSHSTPTSAGNTQVMAMQLKWLEVTGQPQQQPQQTFQRHSSKRNQKNTVPTRDTSRRTGCSVGSSIISPAATMGIMAVKILVRKVQTENIKTGEAWKRNTLQTDQQKGSLLVYVINGTLPLPPIHISILTPVTQNVTSLRNRILGHVTSFGESILEYGGPNPIQLVSLYLSIFFLFYVCTCGIMEFPG